MLVLRIYMGYNTDKHEDIQDLTIQCGCLKDNFSRLLDHGKVTMSSVDNELSSF